MPVPTRRTPTARLAAALRRLLADAQRAPAPGIPLQNRIAAAVAGGTAMAGFGLAAFSASLAAAGFILAGAALVFFLVMSLGRASLLWALFRMAAAATLFAAIGTGISASVSGTIGGFEIAAGYDSSASVFGLVVALAVTLLLWFAARSADR